MKRHSEEAQARATTLAPEIRRRLLRAYDEGKRDLPWRGETDPYRIWVSEIMLQQTRVETVIPYYNAWLARFPDLESLAAAEEEEVLRVWKGLGYYARARNLHRGAQMVRDCFRGEVPREPADLRALPGVGEYTAGALSSIAFGEVAPAVDGNVRRGLCRSPDRRNYGSWLQPWLIPTAPEISTRPSWSWGPWCARHGLRSVPAAQYAAGVPLWRQEPWRSAPPERSESRSRR